MSKSDGIRLNHISIGICTYQRPRLLGRLLASLQSQKSEGLFSYSIIIVDNDRGMSAKNVVQKVQQTSLLTVEYHVVPDANISLARNKALHSCRGQYFAGIDDDEYADEKWLIQLFTAAKEYNGDVILGPVLPSFEVAPPQWVTAGKFFIRKSFPTGTEIRDPKYTRAGNFLISTKAVQDNGLFFNPEYGRTGGEDVDFFRRAISTGLTIIWNNEAVVFESVPNRRVRRTYLLRRALLRGVANAKRRGIISFDTLKSLIAILLYTIIIPFLFLYRHHLFMLYLIKNCDHLGKILARFGIRVVKERVE